MHVVCHAGVIQSCPAPTLCCIRDRGQATFAPLALRPHPQLWAGAALKWYRGQDYFSDTVHKHGLFTYYWDSLIMLTNSFFLVMKPANEEGLAASKNPAVRGSGDGIEARHAMLRKQRARDSERPA